MCDRLQAALCQVCFNYHPTPNSDITVSGHGDLIGDVTIVGPW